VALNGIADFVPGPDQELVKNPVNGHWTGFIPGVTEGTPYRYFVQGVRDSSFKRDPWARELELSGYPDCDCLVCGENSYPWHDRDFRSPEFSDLIVYQLHIGVFFARDRDGRDRRHRRISKFLDVLDRIEYLADLGINAIQLLPVVEFQGEWSLGYNGTDLFSPEMDYCVAPGEIGPYLEKANRLLTRKGCPPLREDELSGQINQLKALIDLCHLHDIAVLLDVVYNHAGGNFDAQSINHFDLPEHPSRWNNLYFSAAEWVGPVFNFGKPEVRAFLIENATMFLRDYHADGLRFDEVSVIDNNGGWFFCQDLTSTLRFRKPSAVQIAEYWKDHRWLAVLRPAGGMGFDLGYSDGLRDQVRHVISEAARGASAHVPLGRLKSGLHRPNNVPHAWQVYNCIENHDFVLDMDGDHRKPRIPRLADATNSRSWYARSRARVAMGLLLTAPGAPMLFMGQEFLEDKLWSDNPNRDDLFLWWDGLEGQDRHMQDFHRYTRDLIWLRRRYAALRSEPIHVYAIDEYHRILAFQRWVPGVGGDVVVVISLREQTFSEFWLGFPHAGHWHEVFNSDVYDHFVNPSVQGNFGGVTASGPPRHELQHSASLTIPANSVLVFARERHE